MDLFIGKIHVGLLEKDFRRSCISGNYWESCKKKTRYKLTHCNVQINKLQTNVCITPVLVKPPKLSNVKLGQYVVGWTFGNIRCCLLGCSGGVIDNCLQLLIGEPGSYFSCVCYTDLRVSTLRYEFNFSGHCTV